MYLHILFLNFEDDRLAPYPNIADFRNIYELFISNSVENKPVYLFFDEIQNIPEWEKLVRTIYDSSGHHIYISGSNAKLLSQFNPIFQKQFYINLEPTPKSPKITNQTVLVSA